MYSPAGATATTETPKSLVDPIEYSISGPRPFLTVVEQGRPLCRSGDRKCPGIDFRNEHHSIAGPSPSTTTPLSSRRTRHRKRENEI